MASSSTIASQVAELKEGLTGRLPAEVAAAFAAEQAELAAGGQPGGIAVPGTVLADASLLDVRGEATGLAKAQDGRAAVLVFYRGAWCPYCNIALRTYQAQLVPALADLGVGLIAISPQKPDGSLSMQEANDLSYTVLSDPGSRLAGQLGILTTGTPDAQKAQETLGLDLTAVNADGTRTLVMPTVAIVDAAGVVRWIDVHPDYTTRSEPGQILEALADALA
jgi:peroxiredoxin